MVLCYREALPLLCWDVVLLLGDDDEDVVSLLLLRLPPVRRLLPWDAVERVVVEAAEAEGGLLLEDAPADDVLAVDVDDESWDAVADPVEVPAADAAVVLLTCCWLPEAAEWADTVAAAVGGLWWWLLVTILVGYGLCCLLLW